MIALKCYTPLICAVTLDSLSDTDDEKGLIMVPISVISFTIQFVEHRSRKTQSVHVHVASWDTCIVVEVSTERLEVRLL